MMASVRPKHVV